MCRRFRESLVTLLRGIMPRNTVTKDSLKRLHIYAGEQHEHQAQKPELIK